MSERPLSNTPQNVERALAFITELRSAGGTDMLAGIRAALDATPDPARMRVVCFMTDGYIGNDEEVLREIRHRIGQSRLFSFGVGADINDFLLTQMSKVGRGATQTVHIGEFAEPVDQVVGRFYAMIGQPVMTDIEIDWGNLQVEGLGDAPIPDLFMGQPLRLIGRYSKPGHGSVRVRGRRGEEKIDIVIPLSLPRLEREHAAIEVMWAKEQIHQRLSQHDWEDTPEVIEAVTEIAMRYNLLSRYTSFVAVERTIVANEDPDRLARVLAAAHLPAGMGDNGLVGAPRPVTLSPNAIKPGDPEILVDAPEQARAVTALLPWGEAVYCTWDAGLQKWLGRFLVPREAQDGHYRVRIFVETALGDITIHSVGYTVDSEAPMMRLELDATSIRAGGVLGVRAYPIEAHADPGEGIAHFRAELRRAVVHLGPQRVVLSPAKDGTHWEGELRLDQTFAAGQHSVRLVVTDRANNTSSSETVLEVK